MAKLSAHGQELARIEKRITLEGGTKVVRIKVLMADGVVLGKSTFLKADGKVDFRSGWKHIAGWGFVPDVEKWVSTYRLYGWRRA